MLCEMGDMRSLLSSFSAVRVRARSSAVRQSFGPLVEW